MKNNTLTTIFQFGLISLLLTLGQPSIADDLLTPEERAWLTAHPTIRVTALPDYPPISFLDTKGHPTGLEQDYLRLLESRLGISFTNLIPTLTQRSEDTPEKKQIDVIPVYAVTKERLKNWNFTKPYLDFPVYLITQDNAPIGFSLDNNTKLPISVVRHYATHDYLQNKHPKVSIDKVDDTCVGLQHVSFGASAGMLTDLPVANWCAEQLGIKNLKISQSTDFHYQLAFAVRKDWPELLGILEKGLASISQADRDAIYDHWNKNALEKELLETYRYWILAIAIVLLAFLIFRLSQWDKKLKHILDRRIQHQQSEYPEPIESCPISQRAMTGNVINYIFIISIIFSALVFTFKFADKENGLVVILIQIVLISIGLSSGFILGSMRRRYEADHFFGQLIKQTNKRQAFEQKLTASEQRLLKQHQALSALTARQLKDWQTPEEIFREITQSSAETLDLERASIWLFSEDKSRLDCMSLYLKSQHLHTVGKPLFAKDFPVYFRHLENNRVIAANDAPHHPATSEFAEPYLRTNKINAMLDGSIWLNNEVIGVICNEHVAGPRRWTLDEQNFVGSIADLTRLTIETDKRRQAEQALLRHSEMLEETVLARTRLLQESEQRFSYVIEQAPIAILIIDKTGTILEFNPEAEMATGYISTTVTGQHFLTIIAEQSRRLARTLGIRALRGEDLRDVELLLKHAEGKHIEFLCSIRLMSDNEGKHAGQMVAIGQDISQKKALEMSLIKAREAAESADRIKSMFVASMSHELRTPLNSILGFLGVVLNGMSGELNATQKDQLGRSYHSAKHLLSLITDVIDISKIEAGYLQVFVESFELKPLLAEAEQAVSHWAKEKMLTIYIDCPEDLLLETDRKRLYQVVLNVLGNAVKYTEKGMIKMTAHLDNDQLIIATQDTGIGIGEDSLAKLFEPFERIESRLKIKTLGTGLGLYLTRKILAQLLGGTITISSKLEQGSIFTVTIPKTLPNIPLPEPTSVLEEPWS